MKHYGDITRLHGWDLPIVDVVTGGSPCQDLSHAGKREGLSGERSGLFFDYIRVVKEMREHDRSSGRAAEFIRPRYLVFENVPGLLSSSDRKDFQTVLTEIIRIAQPSCPDVPMPDRGGGGGQNPAASTMNWVDGRLLGGYSIHSFGEQPCTMMKEMSYNLEHRNGVSESHLSQILTDSAHPKYYLSSKACEGIMRRAEKKGKPLPEILKQALMRQMNRGKEALSNSQN